MSQRDRRKQLEILTTLTDEEANLMIEVLEDLIDALARQVHFRRNASPPSYKRDFDPNLDGSDEPSDEAG
ncbi:MAG: hypothetical protein ABEN55_00730 [Bradymonadaceae bacterium]